MKIVNAVGLVFCFFLLLGCTSEKVIKEKMPFDKYDFVRTEFNSDDMGYLLGNAEIGGIADINGLGFEKVELATKNKTKTTNVISIVLFILVLVRLVVSYIKTKSFIFKSWELVFISCYVLYLYILPFIFEESRNLDWLFVV